MKSGKGIAFKLQIICSVFVILSGILLIVATGGGETPSAEYGGNTPVPGNEDKPFSLGDPVKMANAVISPQGGHHPD